MDEPLSSVYKKLSTSASHFWTKLQLTIRGKKNSYSSLVETTATLTRNSKHLSKFPGSRSSSALTKVSNNKLFNVENHLNSLFLLTDIESNLLPADRSYYRDAVRKRGCYYWLSEFPAAKGCTGHLHPWAWWLLLREFGLLQNPGRGRVFPEYASYPAGDRFVRCELPVLGDQAAGPSAIPTGEGAEGIGEEECDDLGHCEDALREALEHGDRSHRSPYGPNREFQDPTGHSVPLSPRISEDVLDELLADLQRNDGPSENPGDDSYFTLGGMDAIFNEIP